jgi:hypothetical protein
MFENPRVPEHQFAAQNPRMGFSASSNQKAFHAHLAPEHLYAGARSGIHVGG